MTQRYIQNLDYEILTPNGWEDFEGIIKNSNVHKPSRTLTTTTGKFISATFDHRFYQNGKEKKCGDFVVGDQIDTVDGYDIIHAIEEIVLRDTYEIFNTDSHLIIANGLISHQCDELAHAPANMVEAMFTSLSPALATGGKAIITSTPLTDVDMFANIWFGANDTTDENGITVTDNGEGKNGYFPFSAIWSAHPDRNQAWADAERATIGEAKFRQEHCNEFVSDEETLINSLVLAKMKVKEPKFYTGKIRWFDDILPNHTYMIALDPSLGTGSDYSAIQVFRLPDMVQVAEWMHNKTNPRDQVTKLMQVLVFIDATLRDDPDQHGEPDIYWTVENNTIGETILMTIEDTGEERFPGMFISEKKKKGQTRRFRKGMNTDNKKKLASCARIKNLIETDRMTINSQPLLRELKNFIRKESSYSGKAGVHDDLVMSTLLIVRMLDVVLAWGGDAGDLREHIGDEEIFEQDPMPVVF